MRPQPTDKRRTAVIAAGLLAAAVAAGGCHDDVTEVVLVMTSDLRIPADAELVIVRAHLGLSMPGQFSGVIASVLSPFPQSLGFLPSGRTDDLFSVTIQVIRSSTPIGTLVVTRNIFGIRFVPEETRMLIVPLLAACACHGTSCPNPGLNPDCDDIDRPETVRFDPAVAAPSTSSSGFEISTSDSVGRGG
jgi:hypothetical protein